MKLRIGHLSTFYHTAMLLMAEGKPELLPGITAEWVLHPTGPSIVNALAKKELDIAYIGLPPVIIGIDKGIPLVCIAGGHVEGTVISGRTDLLSVSSGSDLQDVMSRLKGHTVAVPGRGSIHDVILSDLIQRFGLKDELRVINLPWADMAIEEAVKGRISVAVGTPALATALRLYAGFRLLCPADKIWPDNPSYGIISSREFLGAHRDVIRGFLAVHEEAEERLRSHPQEASVSIANYTGIVDSDFVLETLQLSPKYCAALSSGFIRATMEFSDCMKRLGYTSRAISEDEIFDTSLITLVHPGPDHYSTLKPASF